MYKRQAEGHALLRLLDTLAAAAPAALEPGALVNVLHASQTAALRPLAWAVVGRHLAAGVQLPPLSLDLAAQLAQLVRLTADGAAAPRPDVAALATLAWLPRGETRNLADAFPLELLAADSSTAAAAATEAADSDAPAAAIDALSVCVVLHALLHHGAVDAGAWAAHGAVGVLAMLLCCLSLIHI